VTVSSGFAVESPGAGPGLSAGAQRWIAALVGGGEPRVSPFGHTRPLWSVDVVRPDGAIPLFVRGRRDSGSVLAPVYDLAREARVIRALTELRVPTPAFVGFDPAEQLLVLRRVPGRGDFHAVGDPVYRGRVIDSFVRALAELHAHDPVPFGLDTTMPIPHTAEEHALAELEIAEPLYDAARVGPEPIVTFGRAWLRRNVPHDVDHTSFVQGDTGPGNFVFHGDDVQLVDFEISHFGDPMEDLAAVCVRDMVSPFCDLRDLFARYDELTSWRLDFDRIRYHRVSKCVRSLIAIVSLAERGTDAGEHGTWLAYWALYVRGACQALAEAMGLRFDDVREGASARVAAHAAGDDAEARRRLDDDLRAGRLRGDDADILRVLTEHAERRCASTRPLMGPMADGLFSPIE